MTVDADAGGTYSVSMNNSAPLSTTEALGSGVTATLVLGNGLASGVPCPNRNVVTS